MYKARRRFFLVIVSLIILASFLLITLSIVPHYPVIQSYNPFFICLVVTTVLCILQFIGGVTTAYADQQIENNVLYTKETALLTEFIDNLRFCYTLDDSYEVIGKILEEKADCSVFYIAKTMFYTTVPTASPFQKKQCARLN